MSGHTPGPWGVGEPDPNGHPAILTDGGELIAIVTHECVKLEEELDANARLIAAAPELLAVLKELEESVAYWGEYDVPLGIADRILDAIAKAEAS
jgi:hypothetical protein